MTIKDIPFNILVDIEFMMGDSTECYEFINPVLIANGFKPCEKGEFFVTNPEEIVVAIYKDLYLTERLHSFFSMEEAIEMYPEEYKEYMELKED